MPSGPVAAAIVLALAVLVGGIYLFMELRHHGGARARERARSGGERLPLFGTDGLVDRPAGPPPARPRPRRDTPMVAEPPVRRASAASVTPDVRPPADFAPPAAPKPAPKAAPVTGPARPPVAPRPATPRTAPVFADTRGGTLVASAPAGAVTATTVTPERAVERPSDQSFHDGETIRFSIPDEGTLQFLPGRLEVVGGPDRGREVRFVRTSGDERTEVTFGRSEGPAYRHVQLMARTVSRQHASMSLIEGHWQLKNLSATNPVLLNGRSLEAGEVAPLLVEGDRIEMGEVVFCFHER